MLGIFEFWASLICTVQIIVMGRHSGFFKFGNIFVGNARWTLLIPSRVLINLSLNPNHLWPFFSTSVISDQSICLASWEPRVWYTSTIVCVPNCLGCGPQELLSAKASLHLPLISSLHGWGDFLFPSLLVLFFAESELLDTGKLDS